MQIDLSCPVENQGTIVKTNSETNEPYLLLKLFNLSEKEIAALTFHVLAYDANGGELGTVPVTLDGLNAQPKTFFAESKAVSLVGIEDAKHFVVVVDSVTFSDDTSYEPSENHTVDADDSEASIDDAMLLRQFVPEAVCFSSEHGNYWRCVCGRANFVDAENCVRCGRAKSDVLAKFSSRDALRETIVKAQEEAEKQRLEEEERLKAEKELKKAKLKKSLLIALIVLIAAAIVACAGFFIYRAVLNSSADKALQSGDYLKAYENYEKTGNVKLAEVTEHIQGNTPANLMFQSGLIASDEENVYYLALDNTSYNFHLIKENKISKEKTTLTDAAGGSLNVTKDWIYFVDVENGYVKRISKDGQTIEPVLDTGASFLSVLGNTMYYIKVDYDNPDKLPEEQCQTLAAQGQMKTFRHLYKMDLDSKKSKLISEESISACSIYGDRIYYLTDNEDEWQAYNLYSMDLNGKDKQVVIDVPVASFLINGDDLYYVRMYNDASKGNKISSGADLDYTIVRKNLKDGGVSELGQQYMVTYMNANSDKLFFIGLNREDYLNSLSGESEAQAAPALYAMDFATGDIKQLVSGEVQIFNVLDDDVIIYIATQGMCWVKADGTGFEQLLTSDAAPQAPQDGVSQNTDTPEGDQANVSQAPDAEPAE